MKAAEPREITRLLFVYDAEGGRLATVVDSLMKLLGKGCTLCAVTHGLAGKRAEFARFEQSIGVPVTLLHRDQARADRSTRSLELPCILAETSGSEGPVVLFGPGAIEALGARPGDLFGTLSSRAAALGLVLPENAERA